MLREKGEYSTCPSPPQTHASRIPGRKKSSQSKEKTPSSLATIISALRQSPRRLPPTAVVFWSVCVFVFVFIGWNPHPWPLRRHPTRQPSTTRRKTRLIHSRRPNGLGSFQRHSVFKKQSDSHRIDGVSEKEECGGSLREPP